MELEKVSAAAPMADTPIMAAAPTVQLRELNAEDLFKLSEIMEKVTGTVAEKLVGELSDRQFGFQIMLSIIKHVPTEIKEFLAHITDQSTEELGKKPFSEPLKIFKALWANKDFQDFLQEAKSMIKDLFPKQ
jgi:hypothetical protein